MNLAAEIIAVLFGLVGSWFVADPGRRAGWGFVAYLVSSAAWLFFAWRNQHWFMFAQQVGFVALSMRGIWMRVGKHWFRERVKS